MSSRRESLSAVSVNVLQPSRAPGGGQVHAGLWLDRFLATQARQDSEARRTLVDEVASIPVPQVYGLFFERWESSLKAGGAQVRRSTVQNRMVVGLGGESALETHLTLHRTYGVPVIPGAALKGLASAYAHQRLGPDWAKGSAAHTILFGSTDAAGFVTFFDALPCVNAAGMLEVGPGVLASPPAQAPRASLLEPDVLTVHHPAYYMGETQEGSRVCPPADWDSPNPVSFLSALGTYLLALKGPDAWVQAAFTLLTRALSEEGIGAKTSSGYGRLKVAG